MVRHFLHVTHRGRTDRGDPDPLREDEVIPVVLTMGVDPASSTRTQADYSTVVVVAWTSGGDAYVVDYFRERVDPMDHAHEIMRMYEQYRPLQSRVESDGYQTMLRSYLNSDHFDQRIPGLEIKETAGQTGADKEDRHLGLQYLFCNGHVHIKPHMHAFREEWVLMGDAAHDDLRDGFWWADRCKMEPSHSEEVRDERELRRSRRVGPKDPMLT